MKTENRVWGFCAFLIAVACVLLCAPAWATKPSPPPSSDSSARATADASSSASVDIGGTNVTVPVTTGSTGNVSGGPVNVSVGGDSNRSYALGMAGLGDVDINEGRNCMGTEAFSVAIVAKQDMELNLWCAALFYDANGKHERAARARCQLPEILYMSGGDEVQCIIDETMTPQVKKEAVEKIEEILQDEDEEHQKYEAEIAALAERLAKSEAKAKKAIVEARSAAQQVRTAQQTVHPDVQQEISEYERRLKNARAAYAGEK